ncbi:unnamed protein product [Polarella glacialis]|uniref:Uncharacterized protein n=1 Tax=Polarella glacialis TaxID=89957 RepID=A0A813DCA4_POLGL|nr:unnamed protein product [Polarella glacialis]CAE8737963.1 unnamed protein product [Polarella glacialis]
MILNFDKLFAKIKLGSESDIAWTKLEMGEDYEDCEEFKLTYHHPVPGVTVLRGQFYINTSVPAQVLFPRPEWLCLPSYKQCQEFFEMELDQIIGPGDATVSMTKARPVENKASEHLAQIRALMAVLADSHEKNSEAEQDQYCTYKARVAVRWDLPEIGSAVHIVAPLDPDTLQPVSDLGVHKAVLSVFQQHPTEANKIRVSKAIVGSGTIPPWAGSHFRKILMVDRERLSQIASLPFMHNLRTEGKDFYLLLNLKCCVRGPPLLPCGETEAQGKEDSRVCLDGQAIKYWERLQDENFSLCSYVRKFLASTGMTVNVFTNFDGRELVSYQALVQRSQWESIRPEFEKAWRIHGAAYRRLNGGSTAPKLVEGGVARWKPCEQDATRFNDACPLSQMQGNGITIRNTFIEVVDVSDGPVKKGKQRRHSF